MFLLLPYDSIQNVPPSSSLLFYDSKSTIDRFLYCSDSKCKSDLYVKPLFWGKVIETLLSADLTFIIRYETSIYLWLTSISLYLST
ncbi:hypothetical protein Hanom_Chr17g01564961 [Helianthus anomalus]